MTLPLRGVRVVDFTWLGAGPYTTRAMADHGADVIRVESGKRLDRLRILPPFRDGKRLDSLNRSGYFADRNTNKRSVTVNLKHPEAPAIILRLIETADVVTSNFAPGTMAKLGVGYDEARAVRPDVIYLEMGMQGGYGPDANVVGYGQTVSALTGLYHLSGLPDQVPVGTGTNYPDHVPAPMHATFAILAALRHRRRTGEGQHIDLSQAETMVGLLGPAMVDATANGHDTMRQGNLAHDAAPQGVYRCSGDDRWLALSVLDDDQWRALCEVLGAEELAGDARFSSMRDRHARHEELDAEITARTTARDAVELMHELQRRGVPAGAMKDYRDLLENDPQLRHRGHFVVLDHPEMGPSAYNAPPFRLSSIDEPVLRAPAPLLGQHTREVLTEVLGLSGSEIDAMTTDELLA
ncbi:CaiB/BaiF CoA transferase family protein [Nocardioides halotolerans]|uniref:CaiB/BaiF CoA transferase family protein n=1 Tax=Nocardioides halotolerans TaxID=433660 RepID=UPI000421B1F2|nr:CoA transferase [Nocardioides halotolerans]